MSVESTAGRSVDLGERTWPQIDDPVLLVPVGSCEQHGPHLPLDTDTILATELARRAAARTGALVGPAIAIAASGEHADFPGTLSIGTDVTTLVLIEIARSAAWASRLIFVNGHGGNVDAIRAAIEVCHHDGRHRVGAWAPDATELGSIAPPGVDVVGDLHAGWIETSAMLAVRPDVVGDYASVPPVADATWSALRERGVRSVSASGALGDPSAASAELGAQIMACWTESLIRHVSPGEALPGERPGGERPGG